MDQPDAVPAQDGTPLVPNRSLLVPYAAPYFAYVTIASFSADRFSPELGYVLRWAVVVPLLWWASRWYVSLLGPKNSWISCLWGGAAGVVGITLWIALLRPLAATDAPAWGASAFSLRMAAAVLLVPLLEELFLRGYVLRLAYQWDTRRRQGSPEPLATALDEMSIETVAPGSWSWAAVAVSTLAFVLGHQVAEWPAAVAFGLLMAWLWIQRRDLLSCVVAHGTANLVLAVYVWRTGEWGLW